MIQNAAAAYEWRITMIDTLRWEDDKLLLIDQTKLPHEKVMVVNKTYIDVADSIKTMKVRGAPAIGVTAAYGVVIAANSYKGDSKIEFISIISEACEVLSKTRPTAVNLFWALDIMKKTAEDNVDKSISEIKILLKQTADKMADDDVAINKMIGRNGADLFADGDNILTHCNAGALATVGYGTALGVIRAVHESGKKIMVYADETRPYLQGSRLTTWELMEDDIPVTLICDNMAGYFMRKGVITGCIVGADRIAGNGDAANKIGTYSAAVLAKENGIPFYVAAPLSTLDMSLDSGDDIPIEQRNIEEVTHVGSIRLAPHGVRVENPAFDVTPSKYITAIITEKGVIYPPYRENLKALFDDEE